MATDQQHKDNMTKHFEQRRMVHEKVLNMVRSKLDESPFKDGETGGPYSARDIGRLKALDDAVRGLGDIDIDGRKVDVTLDIYDCAFAALPDKTAATLKASKGDSSLALELVRRNLTEFNAMARALYNSTDELRLADNGLRNLHDALSPIVEMHGALLSAGIDASEREWAAVLTKNIANLRRLRSSPWHEVALLLKLVVVEVGGDDGDDTEGGDNVNTFDGSPLWQNPPSRAEVRIIEELYAVGDGAPPIRRQVLGARLGLDVADQLEEMGIYDASSMSLEDTRELIELATEQLESEEKEAAAKDGRAGAKEEPDVGYTSRALPAVAAVVSKVAPAVLKGAPKLASLSKLTKLGGKSGIKNMGNKLNAMVSNGGGGGGGGGGVSGALDNASGVIDSGNKVLSGLVTGIETVGKISSLLTPDVEKAVESIQLEQARAQARIDSAREDLENVSLEGTNEEALEEVRTALDKAIAAVSPTDGFLAPIAPGSAESLQAALLGQRLTLGEDNFGTGSYASNEELVAKASGGAALYGMNFFPTTDDIVSKPYTPILAAPSYVEMTGAVSDFTARVWQTTSMSKVSAFHNISETSGDSMATKIATSEGSSRSNATWFTGKTKGSGNATTDETTEASEEEKSLQRANSQTTSSATVIEYIRCPMKSFRIPMARMVLSEDAFKTALEVDSIRDANEFLDAFGSHVSNGRQELGGIFYSTLTMTSSEATKSSILLEAASETLSEVEATSESKQKGGSSGFFGFSKKKASSLSSANSVGSKQIKTNAEGEGGKEQTLNTRYSQYVRCTGPRAPTPETFADALFNDNSSWAVTDRGGIEALVPVTRVLENTIDVLDDEDPDKASLQSSVNLITAAWRIRAKRWGDVLLDETNPNNATVPTAILDLLRTAYPIAQGVVQDLVDAVYNVLEFRKDDKDDGVWSKLSYYFPSTNQTGTPPPQPVAYDVGVNIARVIRKAADTATTGGSGADALLHFMDADDVGVYIEAEMRRRAKKNKADYFAARPGEDYDDEEEAAVVLEQRKRTWDKLGPLARLGRMYVDANADDKAYWDTLKLWEQSWITKDDKLSRDEQVDQDKRWTQEDYEVFQREYFRAPNPAGFLSELESDLALQAHVGINVRVVATDGEDNDALREAVTDAALAMTNEDWIIFRKIWFSQNNPEETNRVVEIIEDHVGNMQGIFKIPKDLKDATTTLHDAQRAFLFASQASNLNGSEKRRLEERSVQVQNSLAGLGATEAEIATHRVSLRSLRREAAKLDQDREEVQRKIAQIEPATAGAELTEDQKADIAALRLEESDIVKARNEVQRKIVGLTGLISELSAEVAADRNALQQEAAALEANINELSIEGTTYAEQKALAAIALQDAENVAAGRKHAQEQAQKDKVQEYYTQDTRFGNQRALKMPAATVQI